jgi:hypothetical protein
MYLSYDRIVKMFTLETEDGVEFLGAPTHAQAKLREYGLSASQAREAVLSAIFNAGAQVDLEHVRKIAANSLYFARNGEIAQVV